MKFKGKVSWWFYVIIIGVAAIFIPIIITSASINLNVIVLIINIAVLVAIELFCILIAFHNYVELQSEALLVVFGLIKQTIPYRDILSLSTTNPESSLAASFDRIEIRCRMKSNIMIAIKDKEIFFDEVKKRVPYITIM